MFVLIRCNSGKSHRKQKSTRGTLHRAFEGMRDVWARGGEAHRADTAAYHQGRSKRGEKNEYSTHNPGVYPMFTLKFRGFIFDIFVTYVYI